MMVKLRTIKKNYRDGSIVAVPVAGSSDRVVGLITRAVYPGNIALVCMFLKRSPSIDLNLALHVINDPSIQREVIKVADIGIRTGEWALIGDYPNFRREDWPLPIFKDESGWCTKRSEEDFFVEECAFFSPNEEGTASSTLFAYKSAEIYLTKLLNKS